MHDYHQSQTSEHLPAIVKNDETKAQERAAKRLRVGEESSKNAGMFSHLAVENPKFLLNRTKHTTSMRSPTLRQG